MPQPLQKLGQRALNFARDRLGIVRQKTSPSIERYIAHNRRKWARPEPKNPATVVLIGLFDFKSIIYSSAYVVNYLARRADCAIESCLFRDRPKAKTRRLYESFGARFALGVDEAEVFRAQATERATRIFQNLRSKWDVLAIREEGIALGDLIYDSYLRYYVEPTVQLQDERLLGLIVDAFMILYATEAYLQRKRVLAYIADDYGYLNCGIPTRVMMRAGVPTYIVCYGSEFMVYQLFGEAETGGHNYPIRWPFHNYRKLFQELPIEERQRARERGRRYVTEKLAGAIDRFTLQTISAYGASEKPIFEPTARPRILVLMHDFVDAPHGYRSMLFADFYDWLTHLLSQAEKTPFEWYLKPHPGTWDPKREQIDAINHQAINELRARFPKAKYLAPSVSNRQIIAEGISAMFTMYGTAGHEFAYLGVPVVNAGDNPHIAYPFNFHPASVEEYNHYIETADRLRVEVDPADIEEYCYMNYFYLTERWSTPANPMDPKLYESPEAEASTKGSEAYDLFMAGESPEREAELTRYFDSFFAPLFNEAPVPSIS